MGEKSAVVIGAGLGGLSGAISLRAAGYDVRVVEKNSHFGGKLNQLEDEGFRFDLGPSILTMPHIFERLFERAGRRFSDYVEIQRLPLEWRSFFEDGEVVDLLSDMESMVEANGAVGEGDLAQLRDYLRYGERMYTMANEGYFEVGLDTMPEVIGHYGLVKALRGFDIFSTMNDVVSRYIENPYLRDIMNFFIKYVGSSPYRAPAVLNLLPYIQNEFGLWYVPGGMYRLARGIHRLAEEIGVEFIFDETIVEADGSGEALTSVKSAEGRVYRADIFVSNMEVIPFYREVTRETPGVLEDYRAFEPSCSGFVLHLGVDREYPHLAHHNFFFSRDPKEHFKTIFEDHRLPGDPTIYLVATSRTDPTTAPPGCENIKILPHIPYMGDAPLSDEDKFRFEGIVLDKLESMGLERLREHTIYRDVWWPEDIRDMYLSNRGSIYGVVSDREKNKGFKAPKRSELYSNLYFVGGSVNPGGGMPMVSLSGQLTADKIIRGEAW